MSLPNHVWGCANEEVALLTGMHTDKVEKKGVLPYLVAFRATSLLPLLQQQKPSDRLALPYLGIPRSTTTVLPDVLHPMACHLPPLMRTSRLHSSHAFRIPAGPQL